MHGVSGRLFDSQAVLDGFALKAVDSRLKPFATSKEQGEDRIAVSIVVLRVAADDLFELGY